MRVENVDAVLTGHTSDTFSDTGLVYVQADDEGAHDHCVVLLDAPDGGAEIAEDSKSILFVQDNAEEAAVNR
jgi:hypothetical protein